MTEPTEDQVKEFWEWCGFEILEQETRFEHQVLYRLNERDPWRHLGDVKLDLNNLFKYAVPKLQKTHDCLMDMGVNEYKVTVWGEELFEVSHKDPALALFWAIRELLK